MLGFTSIFISVATPDAYEVLMPCAGLPLASIYRHHLQFDTHRCEYLPATRMHNGLLDLNEDVLRAISESVALIHPPHWEFVGSGQPHDWVPSRLSTRQAETSEDFYPNKKFCLGWIYLSHVSRRLRTVLIDSPALWARIPLALPSPRSHATILARAQQMPLHLCMPVEPWRTTRYSHRHARTKSSLVFEHIERAIVVDIGEDQVFEWDLYFGTHVYPALSHLAIAQRYLLADYVDVNAPNLVTLAMRGILPIFPSPLPLLRELDLRGSPSVKTNRTYDGGVLRALSRTPALERLSLKFVHAAAFTVADFTRLPDLPIRLLNLRSAYIAVPRININNTPTPLPWSYIEAPDNASVTFDYRDIIDWPGLLIATARQLRSTAYNRIVLSFFGFGSFRFSIESTDGKPGVQIYEDSGRTGNGVLHIIPTYVHVQGISSLHITFRETRRHVQDLTTLHAFFSAFPNISTLSVETDATTSNTMFLILANSTSEHDGTPPAFTLLRTLVVKCTSLVQRSARSAKAAISPWAGLTLFVHSLADSGRPLPCLVLSGEWCRGKIPEQERDAVRVVDERAKSAVAPYVDVIVDERPGW